MAVTSPSTSERIAPFPRSGFGITNPFARFPPPKSATVKISPGTAASVFVAAFVIVSKFMVEVNKLVSNPVSVKVGIIPVVSLSDTIRIGGGGNVWMEKGSAALSSKTAIIKELEIVTNPLSDIKARLVLVNVPIEPSIKVKSNPIGSREDVIRTLTVPDPDSATSVTVTATGVVGRPAPCTPPLFIVKEPGHTGDIAKASGKEIAMVEREPMIKIRRKYFLYFQR